MLEARKGGAHAEVQTSIWGIRKGWNDWMAL